MTSAERSERIGVICVLLEAALWGLFPILGKIGTAAIPPITFIAVSLVVAAISCLVYSAFSGTLHELTERRAYVPLLLVALFIIVVPYTIYFLGIQHTSGVNASVLLLSEIIFMLLFTPFMGEHTTPHKVIGAVGVLIGALCILYRGTFIPNIGDMLIIASTITYPWGNFYARKALRLVSPITVMLVRTVLGSIALVALSFAIEGPWPVTLLREHWLLIVVNGALVIGFTKILWYEGLRRLDVSKATSLTMTFPLFSLIGVVALLHEQISALQFFGMVFMGLGVLFTLRRRAVIPARSGE